MFNLILMVGTLFPTTPSQLAGEWPGILGHNGSLTSSNPIEFLFPASPVQTLWKKNVGKGYSGPVSSGGKVVLFHRIEDQEVVEAYLIENGQKLWSSNWETSYSDDYGKGDGPRATPLLVDDFVIVYSPDGVLRALDLKSGSLKWKKNISGSVNAKRPFFGFGSSPACIDGVLVLNAGGINAGVVGISPQNGDIIWRQTNHPPGYATAIGCGDGNAAVFTRDGIAIVNAKTGDLIFEKRWRSRQEASVNAASPLKWSQGLLFTASYGTGCISLRHLKGKWEEAWSSDEVLSSHFVTPVHLNGLVVGFHGRQEQGTELRCIDPGSGKVYWKKDGVGAGWVGVVGEHVVLLREDGILSVFMPSRSGIQELVSVQVFKGPCWSPCAIAGGVLLARDGQELKAIRLGKIRTNP